MKSRRNVMWIAIVSVIMAAGNAQGITIDPGPLGNAGIRISRPFDDLNGRVLDGRPLDIDFVWDSMKHIELPDSTHLSTVVIFELNGDSFFVGFGNGFLSDENGDSILTGPGAIVTSGANVYGLHVAYNNAPSGLVFHDVHFSIPTPNTGAVITGGTLSLQSSRPFGIPDVDLIIGEWGNRAVPEPITATLGLMGLGVLGMAARRRVA